MSNLILFHDNDVIQLNEVRLSYPHLWEPWALNEVDEQGKPVQKKYSATFLLPIATHKEAIKALHAKVTQLALETFKTKLGADKYCLRDGNLTAKPEQEGHWIVTASEVVAPKVVDRQAHVLPKDSPLIYSGCYVNAYIKLWTQSNKWGKRINANLLGVQHVADGERIASNRPDVAPLFGDLGPGEVVEMGADDFDL